MVKDRQKFWKDKNVFITGASGFIGSWLTKSLVDSGANVMCLIRDYVPRSYFFESGYHERTINVNGKLEDYFTIVRVLNEYDIDTIFHLGAQAIVGVSNRSPLSTFEANIKGTWNVLESARNHRGDIKRIIVASSDKAYGDQEKLPYTEDMALKGRHPYDVSKSCADLISMAYGHTYGLPITISRCGNFFGGGDLNFSRLVPGTINSVLFNERPVIRSDGSYIRDYIYILDAVDSYLTLGEKIEKLSLKGEAFNFSNEMQFTALELVNLILKLMDRENLEPLILDEVKHEIKHQHLSAEKAKKVLKWRSRYSIEDGLKETIEWYRNFFGV